MKMVIKENAYVALTPLSPAKVDCPMYANRVVTYGVAWRELVCCESRAWARYRRTKARRVCVCVSVLFVHLTCTIETRN
jgi:hypothetical protein